MRHKYKGRKLGTSPAHTKAMKRSLTAALLYNDRIKTVESRAKEIRPEVDRIITWAKKGDLHSRRMAIARLGGDKELVREVFEKVEQGMFADRQGGYTRIMKLGPRKGDGAPMVIMELCTEPVNKKASKKAAPKKAAPKKVEAAKDADEAVETPETLDEAMIEELEPIDGTAAEEAEAAEVAEGLEPAAEAEAEAEPAAAEEPATEAAAEEAAEAKAEEKKEEKAEAEHTEEVREEEAKAEEAKAEDAEVVEAEKEEKSEE